MDNKLVRPRRKDRRASSRELPEDIVMDILTRLPAKSVIRYQLVCRRWRALTSTRHFSRMHMKNSSVPMILVQVKTGGEGDNLFLVDITGKRARFHRVLVNSPCHMEFSCDGLMLLRWGSPYHYIVFNPITREKVEIRSTPELHVEVCGIFFHPLIGEYCILWRLWNQPAHLKLLILGSEPRWRELSIGSSVSKHRKFVYASPVVVNDILYWLAFDLNRNEMNSYEIIAFDMKKEEISLMPHPDPKDECRNRSRSAANHENLLKMNGHLSLVRTSTINKSLDIHIWTLKDYANGLWIKSYTINTLVYIEGSITRASFQPIAIVNEELILQQRDYRHTAYKHKIVHRLVAYNLESGSSRNMGKEYTSCILDASAHVPSLVSMKNWKSEILMTNLIGLMNEMPE